MYGYIPDPATDKIPAENTWLTDPITWTHGKWTPAFMGGPKGDLHFAQGLGSISYPGQMNTNVYFAGNNATADSEEGALDAAMIIAEYAFNVQYPLPSLNPMAWFMYMMYHNVMFPKPSAADSIARMLKMPQHPAMSISASAAAPAVSGPKKPSRVTKTKAASKANKGKTSKTAKTVKRKPQVKKPRLAAKKKTQAPKTKAAKKPVRKVSKPGKAAPRKAHR